MRSLVLLIAVFLLSPLLEVIPMAVLAAVAIKVGIDILDWSFLGRAHHISISATLVMYAVLLMTVLVDLIVAVGVGVFVANVLTIERMSALSTTRVLTVDPGGDPVLSDSERGLLERGGGKILLFHLSGPMIFGVAQAISRESSAMDESAQVLVLDLSDVSMLGTTVALALENVVLDALRRNKPVFIAGASQEVEDRLKRVGVLSSAVVLVDDRETALRSALENVAGAAQT